MSAFRSSLALMAIASLPALPLPAIADALPASVADVVPTPRLIWQACNPAPAQPGLDCATASVPLDYSKPFGESITLALIRHKATDQARRIGSLFFNPGGPGASGILALPLGFRSPPAELFPTPVRERFDVISWDERGVGASGRSSSTPFVQCFKSPAAEADHIKLPQGVPDTPEQVRAWIHGYAALCISSNIMLSSCAISCTAAPLKSCATSPSAALPQQTYLERDRRWSCVWRAWPPRTPCLKSASRALPPEQPLDRSNNDLISLIDIVATLDEWVRSRPAPMRTLRQIVLERLEEAGPKGSKAAAIRDRERPAGVSSVPWLPCDQVPLFHCKLRPRAHLKCAGTH